MGRKPGETEDSQTTKKFKSTKETKRRRAVPEEEAAANGTLHVVSREEDGTNWSSLGRLKWLSDRARKTLIIWVLTYFFDVYRREGSMGVDSKRESQLMEDEEVRRNC